MKKGEIRLPPIPNSKYTRCKSTTVSAIKKQEEKMRYTIMVVPVQVPAYTPVGSGPILSRYETVPTGGNSSSSVGLPSCSCLCAPH